MSVFKMNRRGAEHAESFPCCHPERSRGILHAGYVEDPSTSLGMTILFFLCGLKNVNQMDDFEKDSEGRTSGFTLIEMAISIILISLAFLAVLKIYDSSDDQRHLFETHEKMKIIVKSLSLYVETAGRLPCPADPSVADASFGWEWNVAAADTTVANARPLGSCSVGGNDVTGIMPFQTLNLPPDMAIDGWGRYFTYSISPVFTQNNDDSGGVEANTDVHARCRSQAWVNNDDNIAAFKARFCCAGEDDITVPAFPPADDLRIQLRTDTGAGDISPPVRNVADYANIRGVRIFVDTAGGPSTTNTTAAAFVLISHGKNGEGAFLANDTNNQYATGGLVGNDELENSDLDRLYFIGAISTADNANDYFDDIVIWMTQDGIMAANGTSSCQYP